MAKFIDLKDKTFGRLEVVGRSKKRGQCAMWRCRCVCGAEVDVASRSLRAGLTTSCGCYRREVMFGGSGDLSASYWNRILKGARKRGLAVEISVEQAWEKFVEQAGECAITGLPIAIVRDYTRDHADHTASLDRKDSALGYTPENVQWVHRDVNIMKNKFGQDYFLLICRKALERHGFVVTPDRPGTGRVQGPVRADVEQVQAA